MKCIFTAKNINEEFLVEMDGNLQYKIQFSLINDIV